ncbi:MAG: hypothetical protein OEY10_05405 [Nitrosopumilus sp.]|nr:hypothetical protein [Nitrosopumilus sp.]
MKIQTQIDFDGPHYDPGIDRERLTGQIKDVYDCLKDGRWHTVDELHDATGHPHASVSAQLRNMRKERFGNLDIQGRYRTGTRVFEYRLFL